MMKGGDIAGLLIRQARLRLNWSQEGLCRGICAPSYLSKIEQGKAAPSPEVMELLLEGRLVTAGERAELVWQESELTGMEGSTTKIGFALDAPGLVSMLRSGSVNTALVFEAGRRHTCIYNTPFSAFEVCVQGLEVDNRLLADGALVLDYLIEVRGNRTERCRMEITFRGE